MIGTKEDTLLKELTQWVDILVKSKTTPLIFIKNDVFNKFLYFSLDGGYIKRELTI